jgi:hypothetical protein
MTMKINSVNFVTTWIMQQGIFKRRKPVAEGLEEVAAIQLSAELKVHEVNNRSCPH